jgi:molybdate transport system substrate-binding protein
MAVDTATVTRRAILVALTVPLAAALTATTTACAAQQPPRVAAAANLDVVLPEIARQFERDRGARVEIVFGASGVLTRQIRDGAPFDLFLSADEALPQQLTAAGLTRDGGVVYAIGRLAIFAPADSPLAVDASLDGLGTLLKSGTAFRFAIANPDVAPYGKAAVALLKRRALWDLVTPHLVLGDTVAQAAQFASTGNAAGGLIAYSIALSPEFARRGRHAVIAESDYPPLTQRMVLLGRAGPIAEQFYAYLQSASARATFEAHGFSKPK